MMTCKRTYRRLSAFLDGEVTPEEAARIEQHLATCWGCGDEARALAASYQLLERCPQALRPDVRAMKVPAGGTLRHLLTRPGGSSPFAVRRAPGLLPIVTGLLVGTLLGMWVWPRMSPPVSSSPVLLGRRSSPPRDPDALAGLVRDPLEEVYVTLTSARSR
jgi:anti-sigma factor RsiW